MKCGRVVPICLAALAVAAVPSTANANTLNWSGHQWRLKSGTGNLGQHWSPSHVSVNGGTLTIKDSGGVGGGVGEMNSHTYGTYAVTYRWSCSAGNKYAILLWPQNGSRPEIDLAEQEKSDSSQCSKVMATWHPKPGCTACVQMRTTGNFTSWNTIAVNWTSSGLTFLLNGKSFGHVSSTSHTAMHLSIQTFVYGGGSSTLQVSKFSGP